MQGAACVRDEDLRAFLVGDLHERLARSVATHLTECPACEANARRLDEATDPVIQSLRRAAAGADTPTPAPGGSTEDGGAGAAPACAPPAPHVPGYRLDVLGRGGMAVVYRARQAHPRREVALKMILGGRHAGVEQRARFLAEADAIARLRHPNIVQVHEVGQHDGLPYLALEYVAGGSLADQLDGTPQPSRPAAALVEALARAVHHAHQAGVIHRDLKPSNILLDVQTGPGATAGPGRPPATRPDPLLASAALTPKITDFGLARQEGLGLTATGAVVGTPSYMPPEQAAPGGTPVGPAADVYALGALLYELLTGRPPFLGVTTLDTLALVVQAEPVPPARLQPKCPRDLDTITLKCLQKEPRRRYPSAEELADDLRRFLAGESIRARPVAAGERALKWARRHPTAAALGAVTVLAAALLVTILLGSNAEIRQQQQETDSAYRGEHAARVQLGEANAGLVKANAEANQQKLNADTALQAKITAFAELEKSEYIATVALAQQAWLSNNFARFDELLDACPPHLRHWEWQYLRRLRQGPVLTIRAVHGSTVGRNITASSLGGTVAFSRHGQHIITSGMKQGVRGWDAATGQELPGLARAGSCVSLSPDGAAFAVADAQHRIRVIDAKSKKVLVTALGHTGMVVQLVFSPDGKWLASTGLDKTARLWDLTGGRHRVLQQYAAARLSGHPLAFSPDGKFVATANEALHIWEVATAQEVRQFKTSAGVTALAFSPDSQRLAVALRAARLVPASGTVFDLATGKRVMTFQARTAMFGSSDSSSGEANALVYSRDGFRLATGTMDALVRIWDAATGEELLTLRAPGESANPTRGWVQGVAFNPTSARVASLHGDGTVRVWNAEVPPEQLILRGHRSLVAGGAVGEEPQPKAARAWDDRDGQQINAICSVAFLVWPRRSPDGSRYAYPAITEGGAGKEITVFEARTGKGLLTLRGHTGTVRVLAFSPDGRTIATGSADKTVRLWDAADGRPLHTLPGHDRYVTCVVFSPDGKWLFTGAQNGVGRLWDVAGAAPLLTLAPVPSSVACAAFRPDGRRLVTGHSPEGVLRIWDTSDGRLLHTLRRHYDGVAQVTYFCDGERLASIGGDDRTTIWDPHLGKELLTLTGLARYAPRTPIVKGTE